MPCVMMELCTMYAVSIQERMISTVEYSMKSAYNEYCRLEIGKEINSNAYIFIIW